MRKNLDTTGGKATVWETLAPVFQRAQEKKEMTGAELERTVERGVARAKETADRVMDRGARIMAEMAQTDTGKLDEALRIRQTSPT